MKQYKHRRAWVLWVVLVTVAISTVLLAQPAAAVPQPPHIFFGTVTVDGSAAVDGLAIEARIGGVNYAKSTLNSSGATVTNNGTYGTDGQSDDFQVTADDSDTTSVEGGVNGQVIEFFVNGIKASTIVGGSATSVTFRQGNIGLNGSAVNLDINTRAPSVVPTVSSKTVDEGTSITGLLASFTDSDEGDTFTASIDWGDSTVTAGTVDQSAKTVSGSHAYADNGSFVVTITVTDALSNTGSGAMAVTVNNVTPTVEAGANQTISQGDRLSLAATFGDSGSSDTHTATINWGDGTTEAGTVSASLKTITGIHTYSSSGQFTVTVTATDDDGASGSDTLTVTVQSTGSSSSPPPSGGGGGASASTATPTPTATRTPTPTATVSPTPVPGVPSADTIISDGKDAGAALASGAGTDPDATGLAIASAAAANPAETGAALAAAAKIDSDAIGLVLAKAVESNAEAVGAALGKAAESSPEAIGLAIAKAAESNAAGIGVALAKAAETSSQAIGVALAKAAEANPVAVGEALVSASLSNSKAIGLALITTIKTNAKAIGGALTAGAKTNAGAIAEALVLGTATDADALFALGAVLEVEAWMPETAPVAGPDPSGDGMWQDVASQAPVDSIMALYGDSISNAQVKVDLLDARPADVLALPQGQIVSDYVELSTSNFEGSDLKASHVTMSVSNSWMNSNDIHPWSLQFSRYNEDLNIWTPLTAKRVREDQGNTYYTVTPGGFSLWAISGATEVPAPRFSVDNLTVAPSEFVEGLGATVGVQVTNLTGNAAEYTTILWLNSQVHLTRTDLIPANGVVEVEFVTEPTPGTYEVRIGRLLGSFSVKAAPGATPVPGATAVPGATVATVTPVDEATVEPESTRVPGAEPTAVVPGVEATVEATMAPGVTPTPKPTIQPGEVSPDTGVSVGQVIGIVAVAALAVVVILGGAFAFLWKTGRLGPGRRG